MRLLPRLTRNTKKHLERLPGKFMSLSKKKTSQLSWSKRTGKAARVSLAVRDAGTPWGGGQEPVFLSLARVMIIHTDQIGRYGGTDGVRDMTLLQSALAQPEAGFGGQWLHADLFEMAAAYAFHICKNHPFLDGNKRTALVAALVFLGMNGIFFSCPQEVFLEVMLSVAGGKMNKAELAQVFRDLPKE